MVFHGKSQGQRHCLKIDRGQIVECKDIGA